MSRPEALRIDQRAQRVFKSFLPDGWLAREQEPDYRIDYTVEIFDGDESSGLFWNAQLKGAKQPTVLKSEGAVSFSMETEHLVYFIDKIVLPVFLVVIDTTNNEGWWTFLHRYIRVELKEKWRNQTTVAIRIPLKQSLRDSTSLRQSVFDATKYMRDFYPSSIEVAIKAERQRVESLDKRFLVDIRATSDRTDYIFTPKDGSICVTWEFNGEQAVDKARQLVESGGKVEFGPEEVKISGLPDGCVEGFELCALQTSNKVDAIIRLSAQDSKNGVCAWIDFSGYLSGGAKRGVFNCELCGGLISISISLDFEKTTTPINIQFNFDLWTGKDIRLLPNLDLISPFFELIGTEYFSKESSHIEMEFFIAGNRLAVTRGDFVLVNELRFYSPHVASIRKARDVAKDLGLQIPLPKELGPIQYHEVAVVYGLHRNGEYTFPSPNASAVVVAERIAEPKPSEVSTPTGGKFSSFEGGGLPFLASAIDLGFRKITFSNMPIDQFQTEQIDDRTQRIKLVAEEDCVCTIRKCTAEETEMLRNCTPYTSAE